jgi:dolichyl-phosphate-mannose-protein mannosyltransferase
MPRRAFVTCLALFLLSQVLFLIHIQYPRGFSLDENFYVPAARDFLHWTANSNRFNPPLGKYLIAIGMRIWGDTPLGWRFMSSIFGGLTVVGMYGWGLSLFRSHATALWIALITLLNQFLYIQARTGMLDIFMFTFMVWGMAAFCEAWSLDAQPRRVRALLLFGGVMFGLCTACKWLGVVPLGVALGLGVALLLVRRTKFDGIPIHWHGAATAQPDPWYHRDLWRRVGAGTLFLTLVIAPLIAYCATLLPLLLLPGKDGSAREIWRHQLFVWQQHTTFHGAPVQTLHWYAFPANTRPLLFWFEVDGPDRMWARTVLLLGNPVIMWGGLLALMVCVWAWLAEGSRAAFLVLLWYGALYFSWSVIPLNFFYLYYYFPAATVLSLALGFVVHRFPGRKFLGMPAEWAFFGAAALVFAAMLPFSSAMRVPLEWIGW